MSFGSEIAAEAGLQVMRVIIKLAVFGGLIVAGAVLLVVKACSA